MLRVKFFGGPLGGHTMTVFGYHKDGVQIPCNVFEHGVLNCDESGRIQIPTFIYHQYRIREGRGPDDETIYEYHHEEGR